ncbi:hypothetical protein [Stenotrophomonas sp. ESTM1D_MKCIP4_1]|uniref:hypothetical protein n=1 Tax=Stenotrophomonas sp. ESTM1D_MKCIP4_1 TaxID=2072414 RepID=UPI00131EEE75|nr:hypothetical protein [Stenotrophomonas sp. ESTM1D_MKCIP4_1]
MRSIVLPVVLSILTVPATVQTVARPPSPPVPPAEAYQWIHMTGTVEHALKLGLTRTLWEETSKEGESQDHFVSRIGRYAAMILESSRATICGQLEYSADNRKKIQLKTTSSAADCAATGSTLPYVFVKGSEPDAEKTKPFLSELTGPTYAVTRSGVEFKNGRSSRHVITYGERLFDVSSR